MNRSIIGYQRQKKFTEADRDLINARPPPTAAAIANSTEDEEEVTTDMCFTITLMNLQQQQ